VGAALVRQGDASSGIMDSPEQPAALPAPSAAAPFAAVAQEVAEDAGARPQALAEVAELVEAEQAPKDAGAPPQTAEEVPELREAEQVAEDPGARPQVLAEVAEPVEVAEDAGARPLALAEVAEIVETEQAPKDAGAQPQAAEEASDPERAERAAEDAGEQPRASEEAAEGAGDRPRAPEDESESAPAQRAPEQAMEDAGVQLQTEAEASTPEAVQVSLSPWPHSRSRSSSCSSQSFETPGGDSVAQEACCRRARPRPLKPGRCAGGGAAPVHANAAAGLAPESWALLQQAKALSLLAAVPTPIRPARGRVGKKERGRKATARKGAAARSAAGAGGRALYRSLPWIGMCRLLGQEEAAQPATRARPQSVQQAQGERPCEVSRPAPGPHNLQPFSPLKPLGDVLEAAVTSPSPSRHVPRVCALLQPVGDATDEAGPSLPGQCGEPAPGLRRPLQEALREALSTSPRARRRWSPSSPVPGRPAAGQHLVVGLPDRPTEEEQAVPEPGDVHPQDSHAYAEDVRRWLREVEALREELAAAVALTVAHGLIDQEGDQAEEIGEHQEVKRSEVGLCTEAAVVESPPSPPRAKGDCIAEACRGCDMQ